MQHRQIGRESHDALAHTMCFFRFLTSVRTVCSVGCSHVRALHLRHYTECRSRWPAVRVEHAATPLSHSLPVNYTSRLTRNTAFLAQHIPVHLFQSCLVQFLLSLSGRWPHISISSVRAALLRRNRGPSTMYSYDVNCYRLQLYHNAFNELLLSWE